MPTRRIPVLMVRDFADGFSAHAVDMDQVVAFGKSAAEARSDLKKYLDWAAKNDEDFAPPDFGDSELRQFRVSARPEYEAKGRQVHLEYSLTFQIHAVVGKERSGQRVAAIPQLGVRFAYSNDQELSTLVKRFAGRALEGRTPAEMLEALPAKEVTLFEIAVTIRDDDRKTDADLVGRLRALSAVGDPVGDPEARRSTNPPWEREAELQRLIAKLQHEKASVLLLGEPGCGKTTLLNGAARQVEKAWAEESKQQQVRLPARRFWRTNGGQIIAGMRYLGQWEERVESMISELNEIQGVLCVERLLDLVETGGRGPVDSIAAFLLPYLVRGELRMVAEATPAELDACRRLLPGFVDAFQIVPIDALDHGRAVTVVGAKLESARQRFKVEVKTQTADRIVQLFRRFMPYGVLPGGTVTFAGQLVERAARDHRTAVTPDDAVNEFMLRTGLPKHLLRDEIPIRPEDVRAWFQNRIVDQPEAIESAVSTVCTFKAGLNNPERPLGVLLFCGPTGVGKTETAQSLADYFFGAGEDDALATDTRPSRGSNRSTGRDRRDGKNSRLIRLDMSEYGGFDAVERLLGTPHGEPGELIRRIRRRPFSVVLFDEIEKAAPEVFDLLMGVFDEGRLTDRYGRVTNFRSAVVILTSNLGADKQRAFGFDEKNTPSYSDEAMRFFRQEFFNRLDAVVTFRPLAESTVRTITRRELSAIEQREGIASAGLSIEWDEALIDHLVRTGFDARYGARPLQRVMERTLIAPLARWLLAHPQPPGSRIRVSWAGAEPRFEVLGP